MDANILIKQKFIDPDDPDLIPLRIKCPDDRCNMIYTLYIEDFEQGLHTLLGQACPHCKRFIRETDDPEKLLVDLKEIKAKMKEANG
jgi:hypothetical protein